MSTPDSNVECGTCGRREMANFARCLRAGWPMCCGYTMKLLHTFANIEHAVAETIADQVRGARHLMQMPGDKS